MNRVLEVTIPQPSKFWVSSIIKPRQLPLLGSQVQHDMVGDKDIIGDVRHKYMSSRCIGIRRTAQRGNYTRVYLYLIVLF